MKKIVFGIVIIAAITAGLFFFMPAELAPQDEFLRIHIRANSNRDEDQAVKLNVKDAVVEYLIPLLANVDSKDAAAAVLNINHDGIVAAANNALLGAGFRYGAKAEIRAEEFPARNYGGETFPAGIYDALIVELGDGTGDNWWCVAFPPLCFTPNAGSKNIVYRSKILEIIENWKEKNAENN